MVAVDVARYQRKRRAIGEGSSRDGGVSPRRQQHMPHEGDIAYAGE